MRLRARKTPPCVQRGARERELGLGHDHVLPNHYLLQPAERPPMDISALLQMLQSVPPKKKWQVATEGEGESEEGNPFDFPTMPNILDDVPNREDMRVKKKERRNL
ncbi:hypothetical protein DFH09DRAFT_1091700 [Mycena vulgaris]|nr:hypothetical protein DFH09DRAFT_1091700 [Mycena vulgaris]